eukprot:403360744
MEDSVKNSKKSSQLIQKKFTSQSELGHNSQRDPNEQLISQTFKDEINAINLPSNLRIQSADHEIRGSRKKLKKPAASYILQDDQDDYSMEFNEEQKKGISKQMSMQNKKPYMKLQSQTSSSHELDQIDETLEIESVREPFKFDHHFEFDDQKRVDRLFEENVYQSVLRPNSRSGAMSLRNRDSEHDRQTMIDDDQSTVNLLNEKSINLFEIDVSELKKQKKKIVQGEKQYQKQQKKLKNRKEEEIVKTQDITTQKLDKRTLDMMKILEQKDANNLKLFNKKEKLLRRGFSQTVKVLIKNVKIQRDLILQAYGPLVQQTKKNEPPIFHLNSNIDEKAANRFSHLLLARTKIPQPIQVKIVCTRCLKDKIGSGHFIILCSVLDRIGGQKIKYNMSEVEGNLKELSVQIRDFNKKKRIFINKEHREMEQKQADGRKVMSIAPKTGANWFKAGAQNQAKILNYESEKDDSDEEKLKKKDEDTFDPNINPLTDVKLDFSRNQTRFVSFHGRYFDNQLMFDDEINVLIPPVIQPSNVLQFELILLASDTVPKDYVVGWGVFPLVDSEFTLNEGKFKLPLLFGQVNVAYDKFGKIEDSYKQDFDKWLCNLYIQIDRIKLTDIKVHPETKELYHHEPWRTEKDHEVQSLYNFQQNPHFNSNMIEYQDGDENKHFRGLEEDHEIDVHDEDDNESLLNQKLMGKKFMLNDRSHNASSILVDDQIANLGNIHDHTYNQSLRVEVMHEEEQEGLLRLPRDESKQTVLTTTSHEIMIDRRRKDDEIQYDQYMFSVNHKLDLRTRKLTFKKIRYIWDELTEDFNFKKILNIEFHLAIVYLFFLFYLRMWTHYVGQYIILQCMGVPVTQFEPRWYKIYIIYAQWTFIQELVTIIFGILSNSLILSLFTILAVSFKRSCLACFPRMFYKVICWYGVMTLLDPYITLFIDVVSQDWALGDYFKLYNFYYKRQGNGLVGIYITVFLIFAMTVINGFIFYNYMVFVHQNGRILDLYIRLTGSIKSFFIPHDNEVSINYLKWVVKRMKRRNFVIKSSSQMITDRQSNRKEIQYVHIYKYELNTIKRNRLFVKDADGSICEIPQTKILLREDELKQLIDDISSSKASIYGEQASFFQSYKHSSKSPINRNNAQMIADRLGIQIPPTDEDVFGNNAAFQSKRSTKKMNQLVEELQSSPGERQDFQIDLVQGEDLDDEDQELDIIDKDEGSDRAYHNIHDE